MKQRPVEWNEYGDTNMPVKEARQIYNEAQARGDMRASDHALQNIIRDEGRLAAQYAPIYHATIVADRQAYNAWRERQYPLPNLVQTGEYDAFMAALQRGE